MGQWDRSVTCSLAHNGLLSHRTYRPVLLAVPSSPPHGLLKSPCALSPLSPLQATLTLARLQLCDGAALTSQPGLWDPCVGPSAGPAKPVPLDYQGAETATNVCDGLRYPGPSHTSDACRDLQGQFMPFSPGGNGTVSVAGPKRQVTRWDRGSVSLQFKLGHSWGVRSSLERGVLACSPLSPEHPWLLVFAEQSWAGGRRERRWWAGWLNPSPHPKVMKTLSFHSWSPVRLLTSGISPHNSLGRRKHPYPSTAPFPERPGRRCAGR